MTTLLAWCATCKGAADPLGLCSVCKAPCCDDCLSTHERCARHVPVHGEVDRGTHGDVRWCAGCVAWALTEQWAPHAEHYRPEDYVRWHDRFVRHHHRKPTAEESAGWRPVEVAS